MNRRGGGEETENEASYLRKINGGEI